MVSKLLHRILLRRHNNNNQCSTTDNPTRNEPRLSNASLRTVDLNVHAVKSCEDLCTQVFDEDYAATGESFTIIGYKRNSVKTIFSYFLICVTLGILRLFFHWFPKLWITATHDKVHLVTSDSLLVEDNYKGQWKTYSIVTVETLKLDNTRQIYFLKANLQRESKVVKSFVYKSVRYVLERNSFEPLKGLTDGFTHAGLHQQRPLSKVEQQSRFNIYGPNEIRVPLTSILQLILFEILTPFYVFQIVSIIIWCIEEYIYFVIVIMTLTIFGIATYVYQTRQNQKNLASQVKVRDKMSVYRRNADNDIVTLEEISSTDLVVGDLVHLTNGYVYCDGILLTGNCLVDESLLTGESIQVLKTPIPNNGDLFQEDLSTAHCLYAGTKIIQANDDLKVLVTRTGFLTSKGTLVRTIMYPAPVDYTFDRDSTKYCFIMFFIGFIFAIYVAYAKSVRGIPLGDLVIKTLDSITILLPAAIPAATTVGKLHALNKLKKVQIFCTNSKVMNIAGTIDCVCLDKTGTITEDQLDYVGVVLKGQKDITQKVPTVLVDGMSTCHNLASYNGQIQGDPLEVQMFNVIESKILNENRPGLITLRSGTILEIIERYQFSSSLRRMSVLVKNGSDHEVFCKGSPEVIHNLCSSQDTLSEDNETLGNLTRKGFRVLALATKTIGVDPKSKSIDRELVESDLTFLGYLVFENKVKAGSAEVLRVLHKANIDVKMITGDNIETAVAVAKECGLIPNDAAIKILTNLDQPGHHFSPDCCDSVDHLALTGTVWQQIQHREPQLLTFLLPKVAIFARMASAQKQQVVEALQTMSYHVCMCGDGTNDCSALKSSNVGISLSESESSIAAPLTSKIQNISAVVEVIREGRAALVTTMAAVKVILAGNLIQYVGILLLYDIDANFTDQQFLYLDFHMLLYGFFIGYVDACPGDLSPNQPTGSLLALKPVLSLAGHLVPTIFYQFLALFLLRRQEWFEPYVHDLTRVNDFYSYENCVIFVVALLQYTCMGLVFSKGHPYRKPFWTNWLMTLCMVVFLSINLCLAFGTGSWLIGWFEVKLPPPMDFRWTIIGLGLAHLVSVLVIEEILVDYCLGKLLRGTKFDPSARTASMSSMTLRSRSKGSSSASTFV